MMVVHLVYIQEDMVRFNVGIQNNIKKKGGKMMHFICSHCEKEIRGLTIVIDKTHFVHQECEEAFRNAGLTEK